LQRKENRQSVRPPVVVAAEARPARMTTAEASVETLLAHGIDTVYGLPGLHNDPLFDAFHGARDRLRVLHTRHEQAAGYMALGAALATGKPQAFAVVTGPGLLNAGAALLTAQGMNAPCWRSSGKSRRLTSIAAMATCTRSTTSSGLPGI